MHTFVCIACCQYAGLNGSPDEDRLLKYLFDPAYQKHNLQTTPTSGINDTVHVAMTLEIRKLIELVSRKWCWESFEKYRI